MTNADSNKEADMSENETNPYAPNASGQPQSSWASPDAYTSGTTAAAAGNANATTPASPYVFGQSANNPTQQLPTNQTQTYNTTPVASGSFVPPSAPPVNQPPTESGSTKRNREKSRPGWMALIGTAVAAALLASVSTVGAINFIEGNDDTQATDVTTSSSTGGTTQLVSSTGEAPDWEAVTDAVENSVVSISVTTSDGEAAGSGVIYDADGHIITNNHVVSGASEIQVTLADGRIYEATITGTDSTTDLAVIQLVDAPDNLTVATMGDSDSVSVGADVLAIGNPLGLSSTATTGIISALDRPVVTTQEEESEEDEQSQGMGGMGGFGGSSTTSTEEVYTNAIQIDAAINPCNSGGPLFDESGAVIGITSSIASLSSSSDTSGSIGIGFAIPINMATKVADQLIESGTATHAYLGVYIGDGSATTSDGETRTGAEIGSVSDGTPAYEAGLQEGDVVTAIDGKTVSEAAALTGYVRQYSSGDTVTLTVIRDGETMEIQATLAEREED